MRYPWIAGTDVPEMPSDLPLPAGDDVLGIARPVWHTLFVEADATNLAVTFRGTGRPPELVMGFLYSWPLEPEGFWRFPTLEELYDASGLGELEGVVFELPPFPAGQEFAPDASGILLNFRQRGAVDGSEAALRFRLATGIVGGN